MTRPTVYPRSGFIDYPHGVNGQWLSHCLLNQETLVEAETLQHRKQSVIPLAPLATSLGYYIFCVKEEQWTPD